MIKLFVPVTIFGFSAPCFAANEVYANGVKCEKKTAELTNRAHKTIGITVFSINRRPISMFCRRLRRAAGKPVF